ncbi:hypothetical protein [Streptomyces phaeochromogenes]|uniref:hypothetical protein n=1 Tax=Streptomyces phaeochromogenes TaxID=1923 RepID=UPI00386B830B|nr:hypothetical protein OHB08_35930 [Streptomyces phaeochromogenes]
MSGSIRMPPGSRPDTLPYVPRQRRPSWAEPDPVDELAHRLEEFIASAVHPDEIAALLESDGMSDDQIREKYGVKDSFSLAEELYERVERRHPEPAGPAHDPWEIGLLGCLLRGVVFALPGLGYVLGAPLLAGPQDGLGLPAGTVPLLAGALCGWTWNQGLAHRAYSWLGLGDKAASRRSLLVGAPAGALLGSLVALAVAPGHLGAVAFAAGQSCYLAAATVLLVMGRERTLLAALLPMAAGALLAMAQPVPETARLALLLGSLGIVGALAAIEVAPAVRQSGDGTRIGWSAGFAALLPFGGAQETKRPRSASPWLAGSLPYAFFGLGSGVLVVFVALGDVLADGSSTAAVAAPAAVALTLSMGPAEWLLYRFRSGSLAGLRSSSTSREFWRTTAGTLVKCLSGYLAALFLLSLATAALWPHAPGLSGVRLTALLLLGVVLWTGLLLQSFGAVLSAAVICCAAGLAQAGALLADGVSPHLVGLVVYGAAAAVLATLVCWQLGRATAHR